MEIVSIKWSARANRQKRYIKNNKNNLNLKFIGKYHLLKNHINLCALDCVLNCLYGMYAELFFSVVQCVCISVVYMLYKSRGESQLRSTNICDCVSFYECFVSILCFFFGIISWSKYEDMYSLCVYKCVLFMHVIVFRNRYSCS